MKVVGSIATILFAIPFGNGEAAAQAVRSEPAITMASPDFVFSVCFSADGRTLFSGGGTPEVASLRQWDLQTEKQVASFDGHVGYVYQLALSPDGQKIASAGRDKTVMVWDINQRRPEKILHGHSHYATCVTFSSDGKRIASGSRGTMMLWDARSGERTAVNFAEAFYVNSIAFSPDSRDVVMAFGTTIKRFDAITGHSRDSVDIGTVNLAQVAWAPNGEAIVAGISADSVTLFDPVNLAKIRSMPLNGVVQSVTISPDSTMIATGAGKVVQIWELKTGKPLATFEGHERLITSVCFSLDNRLIASAGSRTMHIWKLP